ncbi:MAG: hypothetical protein H6782_04885 [Candidatus Nomurabacteria bacterium]|nr:MAG: hypothetical protein H6782_04885 [Candidatus Nomurabacteria bacterium]
MNSHNLKLFFGMFATILLLPATGQAYFTTNQTATKLSENTVMYTIDYRFGLENRGLIMPIGAIRENGEETKYLKYDLTDKNGDSVTIGKTAGFVFTSDKDVEIIDNQYYLPPNKVAVFTLVTLLTIADEEMTKNMNLSLSVRSLPFTMIINDVEHPNRLNPSELKYYKTPEVKFEK